MQLQTIRQVMSNYKILIPLSVGLFASAGCQSSWNPFHKKDHASAPVPVTSQETTVEGTPVGDERTAMEAATDAAPGRSTQSSEGSSGPALAPGAPDSYVVKKGDTLWDISKTFLRDPWYWPEIWHVNPQIQNPHLIYPGDTLRLVYIDGRPAVTLERGNGARVEPRVRSQPSARAKRWQQWSFSR